MKGSIRNTKRLIAALLIATQIFTLNGITSLADDDEVHDNPDNGDKKTDTDVNGTTNDKRLRMDRSFQGHRFYVVDANGNRVSSILDVTNIAPSIVTTGDGEFSPGTIYTNAYNEALSTDETNYKRLTWEELENYVDGITSENHCPLPLKSTRQQSNGIPDLDSSSPNGEAIKNWVMQGLGGTTTIKYEGGKFNNEDTRADVESETTSIGNGITTSTRSMQTIMNSYSKEYIVSSPSLRSEVIAVTSRPADSVMSKAYEAVNNWYTKNGGNPHYDRSNVYRDAAIRKSVVNYLLGKGHSKETALVAACLVGTGRMLQAKLEDNTTLLASSTDTIESLGLEQIIPTSSDEQAYIKGILNYEDDEGNRLIDFTTKEMKLEEHETFVGKMCKTGCYLVIEPVFWVRYTLNLGGGKYKSDNYFVYGSYRNIVDYYYTQKNYGRNRPNTWEFLNAYGWRSMTLGNQVDFANSTSICNPSGFAYDSTGDGLDDAVGNLCNTNGELGYVDDHEAISFTTLASHKTDVGYAIHIYNTESSCVTKTRSDSDTYKKKGIPHEAPVPESTETSDDGTTTSDDTETSDDTVTIIKTYQKSEDGGKTYKHVSTHVSTGEPNTIYILNEYEGDTLKWKVKQWYVSGEATELEIDSDTTWSAMKKAKYSSKKTIWQARTQKGADVGDDKWEQDGGEIPANPGTKVEVGLTKNANGETQKNDKVLYVLLRTEVEEDEQANADTTLTQSQIAAPQKHIAGKANKDKTNLDILLYPKILINNEVKVRKINNKYRYTYTTYRGEDALTFAKYIDDSDNDILDSSKEQQKADLGDFFSIGNQPNSYGRLSLDYSSPYGIKYVTDRNNEMTALVEVYSGESTGVDEKCSKISAINKVRVKSSMTLQFHPYIWMTWQSAGDSNKTILNVLSEYERTVIPNDYAEVTVSENSGKISVSSNMWATDKSIQSLKNKSGTAIGANSALKGGATYYLTTPDTGKINVTTYQAVVDASEARNYVDTDFLTPANAEDKHNQLVMDLEDTLNANYKVVQYVNNKATSDVTKSSSTKVGSGADISSLSNGSSTASTDKKYYLNGTGESANSPLLDATPTGITTSYYRFFTLPNGNMYLVSGNSYNTVQTSMKNILNAVKANSGNDTTGSSGTSQYVILTKGEKASNLADTGLDKTAKTINSKTNIVTKMLKTLERNSGDDTNASWASTDGAWYNEGCLGVTIMVQKTTVEVGIHTYGKRTF